MAVSPINFFTTALRAPVGVSDTQLLLTAGSSTPLTAITSGDYVYITVNDGTTVEVMKYTSSGSIVSDTITVVRGQDNTTAKAFPTGSCVKIGWNVQQILDLITDSIDGGTITFPSCVVTFTTATGLPGIPDANVFFAVNTDTGSMYYFKGPLASDWVYINSNSVLFTATAPTDAPPDNVQWNVDIVTQFLYYWNGVIWTQISTQQEYTEVWRRSYVDVTGVAIAVGSENVFGDMETANTIDPLIYNYTSNPYVPTVMTANENNGILCNYDCIAEFYVSANGTMADTTHDCKLQLAIFHADGTDSWDNQLVFSPNAGGEAIGLSASSGPLFVNVGDVFDVNLVCVNGGGTYIGFTLLHYEIQVKVIALR